MKDATILVVDDEPQIRRVLRATLSSNGYDVVEAKDGRQAIAAVLEEHPDLILLDVNLPGMNGFEACRKIRLSFAGPVIMDSPKCRTGQDSRPRFGSRRLRRKTVRNRRTPRSDSRRAQAIFYERTAPENRDPGIQR